MFQQEGRRSPIASLFLFLMVLAVLGGLTGCENVNRLREAQAAWNDAASRENTARLEEGLILERTAYASALDSLTLLFADSDSVRRLSDDKLLGVAYSLKALTHWKLQQYDEAKTNARNTLKNSDQLFPRDLALMTALDGLISNDQMFALRHTPEDRKKFDFRGCKAADERQLCRHFGLYDRAIHFYGEARKKVAPDHPVQLYLVQAALLSYRNLVEGVDIFSASPLQTVNVRGEPISRGPAVVISNGRRGCEAGNWLVELQELAQKTVPDDSKKLIAEFSDLTGGGMPNVRKDCSGVKLTVPLTPVPN